MSLYVWLHRVTSKAVPTSLILCVLLLSACSGVPGITPDTATGHAAPTLTPTPTLRAIPTTSTAADTCPDLPGYPTGRTYCYTPHQLQVAYGVESLIKQGFTGKGQTVVDIVSFGSPTLQEDMDAFDRRFGLPNITLQIISPIGTRPFDPHIKGMTGWAGETTLDVQLIHAIAPDAGIVVLTSPISETEGTVGLPEFLQLEQYAVAHHLGNIVSNSWGASEVTLTDTAGQQEVHKWDTFLQQATTQQGMTYFASSGDNGATDFTDLQATKLSPTPTTSFITDDPWISSVGGTSLIRNGTIASETAWNSSGGASGGGFSTFFPTPSYQKTLPASVQSQLQNRRGVPDVSADADPLTGMAFYENGEWSLAGGTSASAPLWAGIMTIANQMAGHPLGFINPGLYKLAQSSTYTQDFHDITIGNNSVREKGVQVQGYTAAPGWDPVTGLGSPNAEKLIPDLIAAMK